MPTATRGKTSTAAMDPGPVAGVWEINPAVPGFAAATALAIAVTLATAPPSEEITRLFDEVNSPDWVDPTHASAP